MKTTALAFTTAALIATTASAVPLINEFQPNPDGADPSTVDIELLGTPNTSFSGVLISIESDPGSGTGTVDRAANVSGNFDANGILVVNIPDLENPSFTFVLLDSFTGTAGSTDLDGDNDGVADDLSSLGNVLDAIGIQDTDGEPVYGAQLGGVDMAFSGSEPELVFRDSVSGTLYAVNDNVTPSADAIDQDGNAFALGLFSFNPAPNSFGAVNPTLIPEPTSLALLGLGGLLVARRRKG